MKREGGPLGTALAAAAAKQATNSETNPHGIEAGRPTAPVLECSPEHRYRVAGGEEARCTFCAFADSRGWWGPSLARGCTHCRRCCTTFRSNHHHCPICCRTFRTDRAARTHQRIGCGTDPATALNRRGQRVFHLVGGQHGDVWALTSSRGIPPSRRTAQPKQGGAQAGGAA